MHDTIAGQTYIRLVGWTAVMAELPLLAVCHKKMQFFLWEAMEVGKELKLTLLYFIKESLYV